MKLQNKDSIMNLGDTSFRRKNLLDDYKVMLQGITEQLEEWNTNNNSQINFYQYVAKSGLIDEIFFLDYYAFISGKFKENIFQKYQNKKGVKDEESLINYFVDEQKKRGRTYTNALVKIGLLDEKRKITEIGENLLNGKIEQDSIEKLFSLTDDNIIFLRQLLKLKVYESTGGNYIYPYRMGVYLLSKFEDIPQNEFSTILSLIKAGKNEKEYKVILNNYELVKNKKMSFSEYIAKYIQTENNEILFKEKEKITKENFRKYFINRKSKEKIEDYFKFYKICLEFLENKNTDNYIKLKKISKKESIKKAFGYNKIPFKFTKTIDEFFEVNKNTIFSEQNIENFNSMFYDLFRNSKNYDLIFEYNDMTIRTFNLSGIISFENGLVNLLYKWFTKNIFLELINMKLSGSNTEIIKDNFLKNKTLIEIFDIQNDKIINFEEKLRKENNISNNISLIEYFLQKVNDDFEKKIEKRFSNEKICEILSLIRQRKDIKINEMITDNAKIPTIFEYILAIAWHRITDKEFNLKESMNLSLDGDGYPLSHAPGGDGDIIAKYKDFDIMLEATLMDKNIQKRGELEPVIRHSVNLTIKNNEQNRKTYTFFVANELDTNVINIFRAASMIELASTQEKDKYTNGVKIYSLSIENVEYLLKNKLNYTEFLQNIFEDYNENIPIKNEWHQNIWEKSIKKEKING